MGMKEWIGGSGIVMSMLMVQLFNTGLQLLSKIILSEGSFVFALMAYRHVIAAFFIAPFAIFWESGKGKELSWSIGFWLFMNALTGISMAMGFYYYGLRDTTATYATNFLNLIPIVTFGFCTIFGLEKLRLGTKAGKVKTAGTILCVAGALTISLYKGKEFYIGHHTSHHLAIIEKVNYNWARGSIFLASSCLSYAVWFVIQVQLIKAYPHKFWATLFTCLIASIQVTVVGLCVDTNKDSWTLGWNLQLLTIIYSGVLATATTLCLISWAVAKRGPTYPSMFNPLSLVFVAISEALLLHQAITVGSLVGMILVIAGLYSFLWGKNKESNCKALPKATAIGPSMAVPHQSIVMQSTAIVMPTSSRTAIATPTASPPHMSNNVIKNENLGGVD